MLGLGELFAHEAAFRLGWGGTKVRRFCVHIVEETVLKKLQISLFGHWDHQWATGQTEHMVEELTHMQVFPIGRNARTAGPGIEVVDDPMEQKRRDGFIDDLTSLE